MVDLKTELQTARAECRLAKIATDDLPATLHEAYSVALNMLPAIAAWKIGGANPWSQKVFGNTEVFFGPLAPQEVFNDTETVDIQGLFAPLAEPEIILEIGDVAATDPDHRFTRMGLGFEIPASVLPDDCRSLLTGQVADRAGAGALWIGALQPFDGARLRALFLSEFQHNQALPVAGKSSNVFGGPLGAATEFLDLAHRYGIPLEKGQFIATGGLNPAVAVAPGDSLRFSVLGVSRTLNLI